MDRPCRVASRVTDYRQYHLSRDLEEVVQGLVQGTVSRLEANMSEHNQIPVPDEEQNKELLAEAKELKEKSIQMQLQVENMKLHNKIEAEKMQQEQWAAAMEQLKMAWEQMMQEHQNNLKQIQAIPTTTRAAPAVNWLQEELQAQGASRGANNKEDRTAEEEKEKARLVKELQKQQEELQRQIEDITGGVVTPYSEPETNLTTPRMPVHPKEHCWNS